MLTGGKRIARENVFAREYDEHFAKGDRYGLLRLLLSRMVAPLDRRYRDLDPAMRELRQIEQWEQNAVGVLLDSDALVATQRLQKLAAEEIERKESFQTVREGEQKLLYSVAESVVEWLADVLKVQKNMIGAGGVLDVQVIRGRPGTSQLFKVDTGNNTLLQELGLVTLGVRLPHDARRTRHALLLVVCSEIRFNLGFENSAYLGSPGNPMMALLPVYNESSEDSPYLNTEAKYFYGKPKKYGAPDAIPIMGGVPYPYYGEFVSRNFSDGRVAIARFNAHDWPAATGIIQNMISEVLSCMIKNISQ